jgi:hypothetical protein
MPDWSLVSRTHVLQAMAEYDRIGDREFLRRYGFGRSRIYTVWNNGQEYDSKAILGAAYFHATGTPAGRDDFRGGEQGAAKVLQEKGFDVAVNEVEAAAEELRAARQPARTTASSTRTTTGRRASGDRATAPEKVTASRPKPRKTAAAAPVLKICPTCNMALPATGICDFCV